MWAILMATYTETKNKLDEIATRSTTNSANLVRAKKTIADTKTDFQAMGAFYSAFATQLVLDAAANSTDPAWQAAKAELDQMIIDFQAAKAAAITLNDAIVALG